MNNSPCWSQDHLNPTQRLSVLQIEPETKFVRLQNQQRLGWENDSAEYTWINSLKPKALNWLPIDLEEAPCCWPHNYHNHSTRWGNTVRMLSRIQFSVAVSTPVKSSGYRILAACAEQFTSENQGSRILITKIAKKLTYVLQVIGEFHTHCVAN